MCGVELAVASRSRCFSNRLRHQRKPPAPVAKSAFQPDRWPLLKLRSDWAGADQVATLQVVNAKTRASQVREAHSHLVH